MRLGRRELVLAGGALAAFGMAGCADRERGVRIGFVVKQPEEQWFQDEWRYASRAAAEKRFEIIPIGAGDGDSVLTALDTLYARHAQGVIICAPDPKLGSAILLASRADRLKLMSVDDRLIDAAGRPIAVPHVGISAHAIGEMAGRGAAAEARSRGWQINETGVLRIAYDSLDTARERTIGGRDALLAADFPASAIFDAPQRTTDTDGGFTATGPVVTRHAAIRHWLILGMNDETVLGGVRAAEGLGFAPADLIGVGIGGSGSAVAEFGKSGATGFWASVLLSPRRHGYDTAMAMYRWIVHDIAPPPVTYTTGTMMQRENFRTILEREASA